MNESLLLANLAGINSVLPPAVFFTLALFEALMPARASSTSLGLRWFGNVALFGLGWLMMLLVPFLAATSVAVIARAHGLGLLNVIHISPFVAVPVSVAALDLIAYWEHRLFHWFRPFWRLHALHHSDTDVDVATYVRHHPLEYLAQAVINSAVVVACEFAPLSLALYVALAAVVQMSAHANLGIGKHSRWISAFFVTPDFHHIHHSREFDENNANFSNVFSLWDWLFGTARIQARGKLRFGLPEFVDAKYQHLERMLMLPLLIGNMASGLERPLPEIADG